MFKDLESDGGKGKFSFNTFADSTRERYWQIDSKGKYITTLSMTSIIEARDVFYTAEQVNEMFSDSIQLHTYSDGLCYLNAAKLATVAIEVFQDPKTKVVPIDTFLTLEGGVENYHFGELNRYLHQHGLQISGDSIRRLPKPKAKPKSIITAPFTRSVKVQSAKVLMRIIGPKLGLRDFKCSLKSNDDMNALARLAKNNGVDVLTAMAPPDKSYYFERIVSDKDKLWADHPLKTYKAGDTIPFDAVVMFNVVEFSNLTPEYYEAVKTVIKTWWDSIPDPINTNQGATE